MSTSDLIDKLVGELEPTARHAVVQRLSLGIGAGALASFAFMVIALGLRPDLGEAVLTSAFWIKLAYTGAIALFAVAATERLGRPGCTARRALLLAGLSVATVCLAAGSEYATAASSGRRALIWGGSSTVCPWYIVLLGLPILLGILWSLRGLAPTRLALAGTMAGIAAGGSGALVYSLHCTETSITFLALWYSFGIAIVGLIGTLVARRALHW